MEGLPIAQADDEVRTGIETAVQRSIAIALECEGGRSAVLDWLRVEYAIAKPTLKLQDLTALDADALIAEVKKVRGKKQPLSVAGVKGLKEEHARTVAPLRQLAAEARGLEWRVSELVNRAYGLTAAEEALLWQTAPPRMPISPP